MPVPGQKSPPIALTVAIPKDARAGQWSEPGQHLPVACLQSPSPQSLPAGVLAAEHVALLRGLSPLEARKGFSAARPLGAEIEGTATESSTASPSKTPKTPATRAGLAVTALLLVSISPSANARPWHQRPFLVNLSRFSLVCRCVVRVPWST